MIASIIGVRRTRRYPPRPTQRWCRLRAGIRALRGWPDFATKGADMHRYVIAALVGTLAFAGHAMAADPQYTTIKMEIDVENRQRRSGPGSAAIATSPSGWTTSNA